MTYNSIFTGRYLKSKSLICICSCLKIEAFLDNQGTVNGSAVVS